MKLPIYMDSHATTPVDPRVLEAILPTLSTAFGNAASHHHCFGWATEAMTEKAREQVAALIHCHPKEIIWTSGATESDNMALKGVARMYAEKGRHIITSSIEHLAILDSCRRLEKEGWRVTYLPVGSDGLIQPDDLAAAIADDTVLVSIMLGNNEIGTLNPIEEIGGICKSKGVFLHCDAVQALAYEAVDVEKMGIDLLSITAHKMYGPKGSEPFTFADATRGFGSIRSSMAEDTSGGCARGPSTYRGSSGWVWRPKSSWASARPMRSALVPFATGWPSVSRVGSIMSRSTVRWSIASQTT
jgi:cysteine desulfurase